LTSFGLHMIPISPCFNVQSRWEMDTLVSFYAILLTLLLFCAFKENLRVLLAKLVFWEDWGEELRFEESRGIKNKAKHENGRSTDGHQRRTPSTTSRPAICHGLAVPGGTTVPCVRRRGIYCFVIWDLRESSFPLVLGFRERLERVQKNLRLGFEFMLLDCKLWRFDDCSTFKH